MTRAQVEAQIQRLENEIAGYRTELRAANSLAGAEILNLKAFIENANAAIDARTAYLATIS